VNCAGIPSGLVTSSAAPVSEMFRTVQSIEPPPKWMCPPFSTRCLVAILFWSLIALFPKMSKYDVVDRNLNRRGIFR
jgi:hypothetical protein